MAGRPGEREQSGANNSPPGLARRVSEFLEVRPPYPCADDRPRGGGWAGGSGAGGLLSVAGILRTAAGIQRYRGRSGVAQRRGADDRAGDRRFRRRHRRRSSIRAGDRAGRHRHVDGDRSASRRSGGSGAADGNGGGDHLRASGRGGVPSARHIARGKPHPLHALSAHRRFHRRYGLAPARRRGASSRRPAAGPRDSASAHRAHDAHPLDAGPLRWCVAVVSTASASSRAERAAGRARHRRCFLDGGAGERDVVCQPRRRRLDAGARTTVRIVAILAAAYAALGD